MNINHEKTKKKILAWCVEDWTSLFSIEAFVEEFYNYSDQNLIIKTSLDIIKNLLDEELVKAGDLLPNNTFKIWNKNIDEIIEEIKIKWNSLNRELEPHEIVWFEITEEGKKEFEYLNSLPELKETDPFYFDDK